MPPTAASAKDIILAIVDNLEESLEPLLYSVLAPGIYDVYLHPDDLERLSQIEADIVREAKRAILARLEQLRRESRPGRLKRLLKFGKDEDKEIRIAGEEIAIRLLENLDRGVDPGDILVVSSLALKRQEELGSGQETRKITTLSSQGGGRLLSSQTETEKVSTGLSKERKGKGGMSPSGFTLRYRDETGEHVRHFDKSPVLVGRGGAGHPVDLKLETLPDVSRVHLRIRHDPQGGGYLKDMSTLGTTLNGVKVEPSLSGEGKRSLDRDLEVPIPERATIRLADVLDLEYEATP